MHEKNELPAHPTVSVVIPAFNAEATIERAILSAKNQSYSNLEIVVGDDGSTDKTAEIAERVGAKVVRLPKENGAVARNAAFAMTSGDFIFLLDSDDEWLPGKIEAHLKAHAENNPSFVIDPSRRIRENGQIRGLNGAGSPTELTWEDMMNQRNWSSGSAVSVSRETWLKVSGFNPKLVGLQDIDFLVRVAKTCGPGYRTTQSFTNYNLLNGGVSRGKVWREQIISDFTESCDFIGPEHIALLRQTVGLRNAINSKSNEFWSHIRWGKLPLTDIRVWRAFALVLARKIHLA